MRRDLETKMTDKLAIAIVSGCLAALAGSPAAFAAPCSGFTDVDATSPFCPSVEWLKNRNVTVGCTASAYCPDAAVSRLGMAAFMNRLGTALTPVALRYDGAPGAIDLDAGIVACQTADSPPAGIRVELSSMHRSLRWPLRRRAWAGASSPV
jgi:hypothetical protein